MSCGRPTDEKLFAGYIRGVRVTASWGATWITPGNHLRAYFDLRVVVWLTVEGLGLTGKLQGFQDYHLKASPRLPREL